MDKADLYEWKQLEATQRVFDTLKQHIEEVKWTLSKDAGKDPAHDRYLCGMIYAFELVLNVEPDEGDL